MMIGYSIYQTAHAQRACERRRITWFSRNKLFSAEPSDSRKYVSVRGLLRRLPEVKFLVNKSEQVWAGGREFQTNMAQKTLIKLMPESMKTGLAKIGKYLVYPLS